MAEEQKPSLAFTFQKKKVVQKVAVNLEDKKDTGQLITGFDGAKAQVVGGDAGAEGKSYVIPKLENTFKTGVGPKKFTPTFKPPSNDVVKVADGEDKFVQAASTVPVITEYGLHLRDVKQEDRGQASGAAAAGGNGAGLPAAVLEERAFREAVEELPDVADVEAYESMPVEEFGRAMLRGMGWQEGMGVGRNRKVVEAIEYVRRPERLGLGAQPVKLGEDPNKPVKMGDKPRKQDMVLPPDANGRQRNIRTLDEQLVPRAAVLPGPQPGKAMRVTGGPHAGLACTALEQLPKAEGRPDRWRVRLTASNEEAEVLADELGEKWEREGSAGAANRSNAAARAGKEEAGPEADRGRDRGGSSEREREREERERGSHRGRGEEAEPEGRAAGSGRRGGEERGEPSSRHRDRDEAERGDEGGRGGSRGQRQREDERGVERRRERDADRDRERDRDRSRQDDGGGGADGGGGGGSKRKYRDRDRDADEDGERQSKKHHKRDKHGKDEKHGKHDREGKHGKHEKHSKHDKKRHKETREQLRSSDSEDSGDAGGSGRGDERPRGPTWLFPNIQVRIVDKRVRGGKLYLKKGRVVDVHPDASADVYVDDTGDLLRLSESSLETVVPKHEGAAVLVVAGPNRGSRGRLLQASVSAGAAAVQLAADFSIVRLLLDDVAGFVGEMEEE